MNPENNNAVPNQQPPTPQSGSIDGMRAPGLNQNQPISNPMQNQPQQQPTMQQPPQQPQPVMPPPSLTPQATPNIANKKPSSHNFDGFKSVLSTILMLAIAPLIAFAITYFALQSYQVDGQSMETTLQNRDRLIVNKTPRTIARITKHPFVPNRGDIIIFNQANLPDTTYGTTKQLIKRVIGLPGDRVVIKNGKITIYNQLHPDGFNPDQTVGYHITAKTTDGEVDLTLQQNQIFVCGDNRPNSEDSRYFGPINADQIVGKLVFRLLPLNKAEKF